MSRITLEEMRRKSLALIEEYDPESDLLTSDPDIAQKHNDVINYILYELARIKKIPRYVALPVTAGQLVTFEDLKNADGKEVYQVSRIMGVPYEPKANGTIFKMLATGLAEIDYFIYPERITSDTPPEQVTFTDRSDIGVYRSRRKLRLGRF